MARYGLLLFVLGVLSLAIFIVLEFNSVTCEMNKTNPSQEWREKGEENCQNTISVTKMLGDFIDFVYTYFT